MDLREATSTDLDRIRTVAAASLEASYGELDDELRERAVEAWYGEDGLDDELTDDDTVVVVATEEGEVVGFVQAYLVSEGEEGEAVGRVDWLHVHPDHRGSGLGDALLGHAEAELLGMGATRLVGRVLEVNEVGGAFYESHGYERTGSRTLDLAGKDLDEEVYTRFPEGAEDRTLVESIEGEDDRTLFIAYDESDRGSVAPFYGTYLDEEREERYGWLCGNCGSTDVNMDAMGRVECDGCENRRKPSRWDATYGG